MATNDIGRVTPIWRGFYSAATAYELNDIVIDASGSVWWHKGQDITTGETPAEGLIWGAVIDMSVFSELIQAAITTAQTAVQAAQEAESGVAADVQRAETAADNAETYAQNAQTSAANVGAYAQAAEEAKNAAQAAASQAAASASSAGASAASAGSSAQAAETSKTAAQTAATQAAGSAETASGAAAVVEQKKAEAIAAIEAEGEEVLESIPEDYTELSGDVGELKNALSDMIDITYSQNLTDPAKTYGAAINETTGAIISNNYYRCSNKIPCTPGETIYIYYNYNDKIGLRKTANDKVAFYTSDDTFISISSNENSYTVPANAAYLVEQGYFNMMRDGGVGIFKESHTTTEAWINYYEIKKLDDDYMPTSVDEAIEELQEEAEFTKHSTGENLIDGSLLVFSQLDSRNILSNKFPISENTKYTLSYSGAADDGTTCYARFYAEGGTTHIDQVTWVFKNGEVTFITPATTVYFEILCYNSTSVTVGTFPMANLCLVYGPQKAIIYPQYKNEISARSIPFLPGSVYSKDFVGLMSLAHMGQSYYFPQNTKWSWFGAKRAGFEYIECDLQVTSDNVIVLIHDSDMRRYGGTQAQTVESLTLTQLQAFDAGAWFDPIYTGTQFPVFDDFVGLAKAFGIKLAMDCKGIDSAERIDAVADILEKWGMEDNVIWITSMFGTVWDRVPNAKIMWPTSTTLINGDYSGTTDGWFATFTNNFPADKKTTDGSGNSVVADGVWFCVDQSIAVADTYGLTDLQDTSELARKYNCKYGLYAIDDNDDMYDYIMQIPYLQAVTSNRITPQSAMCEKFGIGLSNQPQRLN